MSPAGRYLIAVNASGDAVTAQVAVEEAVPGQVFSPRTGGPGRIGRDGLLALELGPLDVQVFSF